MVNNLVDLVLVPLRGLPPVVGLAVLSLASAIGILLVFKRTSNQSRISLVKRHIHAGLFEIRLQNHDLASVFRSQFEILRHNMTYVRLSFVPLLWMLTPLVLLVAQLHSYYGYRGLEPGEPTILKVELRESWNKATEISRPGSDRPPIDLVLPPGLRVEAGALWIPALRQVAWRIVADDPGEYDLQLRIAGQTYDKKAIVSSKPVRCSPVRGSGLLHPILYPGERSLPDSGPIRAIEVGYDTRTIEVLGWSLPWIVVFLVLSAIFAWVLRGPFRVTL